MPWLVCVAAMCVTISAGQAFGQATDKPTDKEPPAAGEEQQTGDGAQEKGVTPSAKTVEKSPQQTTPPERPIGPRFAIEDPNIVLDPVWRGEKLVFNFKIFNDGGHDLKFTAKRC